MAKNLHDLADAMARRAREVPRRANLRAIAVGEALVATLATDTPVDTSEALSNWQIGLNGPVDSDIPPYMPGFAGSTYTYSKNATIATAKRLLKAKKPGQKFFVSNLAGHIGKLNDGSSKQAPAGFIEAAIMKVRNRAKIK